MTVPSVSDFRDRFPEFTVDKIDDARLQGFLDRSDNYLSKTAFGSCRSEAILYYTAHVVALSIRTTVAAESSPDGIGSPQPSGKISSSGAGGLTVSFMGGSPPTMQAAWYSTTPYGEMFQHLVQNCISRVALAGSPGI